MVIWRHYRVYVLLAMLVTPLFILMPDGKLSTCFTHVRLSILSITHSCDSPHFAEQAADPAWLFHTPTFRSRPVYLIAVAAGGMVLSPLALLLEKTLFSWVTINSYDGVHSQAVAERARMSFELYAPHTTGMMALNILSRVRWHHRGVSPCQAAKPGCPLGCELDASSVSTHDLGSGGFNTALMNFLVPLGAITAFAWAPALLNKGRLGVLGLGLAQSLLILVYPYMAYRDSKFNLGMVMVVSAGQAACARLIQRNRQDDSFSCRGYLANPPLAGKFPDSGWWRIIA